MYADAEGVVYINDIANNRVSVIEKDLALLESWSTPGLVRDLAPLPGDQRHVANMVLQPPDKIALPLHVLERGVVQISFGDTTPGVVDPRDLRLKVATDGSGRIYSVPQHRYEIDVWSVEGGWLGRFTGPSLGNQRPRGTRFWYDNPPPNIVQDIDVDSAGNIWVLRSVRRADWQAGMVKEVGSGGLPYLTYRDGESSNVYRTAVDVIDPQSGKIKASGEFFGDYVSFAGDNLIVATLLDEIGYPSLVISRIFLSQLHP